MSRREARIERQLERELANQIKAARLKERIPLQSPRIEEEDSRVRTPRAGQDPGSVFSMKVTWTCDDPDCDGAWSWGVARRWSQDDWDTIISPKLAEWSKLTWAEIDRFSSGTRHKMHHTMDTDVIRDEAQYRLIEIEKYRDVIFRFRLGNKRRLLGHRIVSNFEIIWFDPTHQIYPTEPD